MLTWENDLDIAIEEIRKRGAKRVMVQVPEGLKVNALGIAERLEKETGCQCITLMDPVFGACDLAEYERRQLHADLVLHFGHTQFVKNDFGHTVYIPVYYEIHEPSFSKLALKLVKELKMKKIEKIALAGPVQFKHHIEKLKNILHEHQIQPYTRPGKLTGAGQLLGCDALGVKRLEKQVQAIAYVGDGNFHSLAAEFTSEKPLVSLNPLNETVEWSQGEREKYVKQRYALIAKAMNAQKFGILVSTKEGQYRLEQALRLKKIIEGKGKQAFIFASDLQLPEYFLGLDIDCFVCTACPRIALEDAKKWSKPLINAIEMEMALGTRKMEEYEFNEIM